MKTLSFNSIKTRLTFWFFIVALTPVLVTLVITYQQRVSVIESRTFDKLVAIRDLKVERVHDWLHERNADIQVMRSDVELYPLKELIGKTTYSTSQTDDKNNIRTFLNRYLNNYPAYEELFVLDPLTAKVIVSTARENEGLDKSNDVYFNQARQSKKITITDIYFSETLQHNSMVFSIPIVYFKNNRQYKIGIFVARIDLENSLFPMLQDKVGLGETGETLIVNNNITALNELRWHKDAPLKLKISAEPALKASQGQTGITTSKDYRNEPVLAAYTYIPETQWGFVSKQDLSELNQPIQEMVNDFIWLFVIFSLFLLMIGITIGNGLAAPIIKISQITKKIRDGNLSVKIPSNSHDEIASLAESINDMTRSLESKIYIQQGVASISQTLIDLSTIKSEKQLLIKLIEITNAQICVFYIQDELTLDFKCYLSLGKNKKNCKDFNLTTSTDLLNKALLKQEVIHLRDITEDTVFTLAGAKNNEWVKEIITIPILLNNNIDAFIALATAENFSNDMVQIIKHSQLNICTQYYKILSNQKVKNLLNQNKKINDQLKVQAVVLTEAQYQAESANRSKSLFLANMSHEIRTPMNAIFGLTYLIQKDNKAPEQALRLKKINAAGNHLLSIINDILDISKIEAGKLVLEEIDFNIETIFNNIQSMLGESIQAKNLTFDTDLKNIPLWLKGDETRIRQILLNFINNSIKFSNDGCIYLRAKQIDKTEDKVLIRFEVQDSGIGISTDKIPSLFQTFEQADPSITRKYGGTGLGLAINKRLAKLMEGEIGVNSKEGKGSTFWFTAWLTVGTQLKLDCIEYSLEMLEQKLATHYAGSRILLVEDNAINLEVANDLLSGMSLQIDTAENGLIAVNKVKNKQYDLVLMDLQMPVMGGLEATQLIRVQHTKEQLPILAMTANVFADDRLECVETGMNGFIAKPVDPENLYSTVIKWLPEKQPQALTPVTVIASKETADLSNLREQLSNIEELNSEFGLRNLRDDALHYLKVLHQFDNTHGKDDIKIHNCLQQEQFTEAKSIAHTIKGAAGTLGLIGIQASAKALEEALREKLNDNKTLVDPLLVESIKLKLNNFHHTLANIEAPLPSIQKPEVDSGTVQKILQQLELFLNSSSTESNSIFLENETLLIQQFGEMAEQLGQQIEAYDYPAALTALNKITDLEG